MLALDLDHFKRINDEHATWPATRCWNNSAGACAPWCASTTSSRAPFELAGRSLSLTVSAGLTLSAAGDTSVLQVIKRADGALYRAKERGRDRLELAAA